MHGNLLIFRKCRRHAMFGLLGQIIGIIIIVIGGGFLFFMHAPGEHSGSFGVSFIVLGLALIIIGGILLIAA